MIRKVFRKGPKAQIQDAPSVNAVAAQVALARATYDARGAPGSLVGTTSSTLKGFL